MKATKVGEPDEVFCFCFSSLKRSARSQRPGAVKGAPFLGAAERTLDGEDRCDRIEQEEKTSSYISIPGRTTVNHDQ